MGEIITVTGMVLSAMPIGEFDRRIVLLTGEKGKIPVFARGSRRMNSHLMGVTQPFVFGRFEIYEGRSSYDMRRADISHYFSEVTSDYEAVLYACYMAELADYYGREDLEAVQMLNLLYVTLKALGKPSIPNELIRYIFELRLISDNGECPSMFECVRCGKNSDISVFSARHYGMLCHGCADWDAGGTALSESCLYALQYIVTTRLEKLYTFTVNEAVMKELSTVSSVIRTRSIDKRIKSLEILESIINESG